LSVLAVYSLKMMEEEGYYEEGYDQEEQYTSSRRKLGNNLAIWGNSKTMNLNHLVLTNVQNSPYYKVRLFQLKTYHEVVDEIYYKVDHLEPWERGTRKTAGQTGMCGGVRGVGAGGVVSTSFCILYKLFTLKLTRKQLNGLLNHCDSPYIRGLGVMYVRYTQAPQDLWSWFEDFLDDEEKIDVKAGGGCNMTIGTMVKTVLTKLEWFSTLFPRIPVPIQKEIEQNLQNYEASRGGAAAEAVPCEQEASGGYGRHEAEERRVESRERSLHRRSESRSSRRPRSRSPRDKSKSRERSSHRRHRSRSPRDKHRRRSRDRSSKRSSKKRSRSRDRHGHKRSHHHRRSSSRERREHRRHRSRSRDRSHRSR